MTSTINASTTAGIVTTADTSGVLALQTAGTTAVTVNASQNVGIGLVPNAWSGSVVLQMTGPSLWGSTGLTHLSTNTYFDGTNYKYIATNFVTDAYQLNGAHVWRSAASGTAGTNVTYTATTTLNANGVLALSGASTSATGVGITFPATQSASTDVNTLDDYEEGTWTPVIGGITSVNYAYRLGTYTKIGNMVYVFWDLEVNSFSGSFNGNLEGLPITVSSSMAGFSVLHHRSSGLLTTTTSGGQLKGYASAGFTYAVFQVDNSGTSGFGFNAAPTLNSSGRSTGYLVYQAST